jgi:hypothetical protein
MPGCEPGTAAGSTTPPLPNSWRYRYARSSESVADDQRHNRTADLCSVMRSDLTRLAGVAEHYGLYRHAAVLWTRAAARGDMDAACALVTLLRRANPPSVTRAAHWIVAHASLASSWEAARLQRALHEAGADEAVTALLARYPASHNYPQVVRTKVDTMLEAEASDAVTDLAERAADASLDDPRQVARLLDALHETVAHDAVTTLLARAGAAGIPGTYLERPDEVVWPGREPGGTPSGSRTWLSRD